MKYLTVVLALLAFNAQAEQTKEDLCFEYEKLARHLMDARQYGVPLAKAYKTAKDSQVIKNMVLNAYKEPMWPTDEYKEKAINTFSDEWLLVCLRDVK